MLIQDIIPRTHAQPLRLPASKAKTISYSDILLTILYLIIQTALWSITAVGFITIIGLAMAELLPLLVGIIIL